MAVTQVGALTDFTPGTVIVSSQVDANFSALKTAFNNLVTGTNALNIDTIAEVTADAGVTIDGVLLKDGSIVGGGAGTSITNIENITISGDLTVAGSVDFGSSGFQVNPAVALQGTAVQPLAADVRYAHTAGNATLNAALQVYSHIDDQVVTGSWANIAFQAFAYSQPTSGAVGRTVAIRADVDIDSAPSAQTLVCGVDVNVAAAGTHTAVYGVRVDLAARGANAFGIFVDMNEGQAAQGDTYGVYINPPPASISTKTSACLYLDEPSTGAGSDYAMLAGSGAYLSVGGTWTDSCSAERKRNIEDVPDADLKTALMATRLRKFERRLPDRRPDGGGAPEPVFENDAGFIAQELPPLLAVPGRDGVAPGKIAAAAIGGWKLHEAEITTLKQQIANLTARVVALETGGGITPGGGGART